MCLCFNHPLFMDNAALSAYNFHVSWNIIFLLIFFFPQPFKNVCLFPRTAITHYHDWLSPQNNKYYCLSFWSLQVRNQSSGRAVFPLKGEFISKSSTNGICRDPISQKGHIQKSLINMNFRRTLFNPLQNVKAILSSQLYKNSQHTLLTPYLAHRLKLSKCSKSLSEKWRGP